jgi:hypothetical protein
MKAHKFSILLIVLVLSIGTVGFLPAVVTENSVRSENAEVPIIREILVLPR